MGEVDGKEKKDMGIETIKETLFPIVKSIISDCICKTTNFLKSNIPETVLNLLANEYADKILNQFAIASIKELEEVKKKARLMEQYQFDARMERDRREEAEQELASIKKALCEIGNIIGAPTMSYAPKIERGELLSRIQKVSEIIQHILGGKV